MATSWRGSRASREAHGLAGVVSLAGCVDLTLTARLGLGDRAAQSLMGGDPEGPLRAAYALADPALLDPGGAGRSCCTAPTTGRSCRRSSRSYEQRMRARRSGSPEVRLTMLEGADHFAVIDPRTRPSRRCWRRCAPWPLRLAA